MTFTELEVVLILALMVLVFLALHLNDRVAHYRRLFQVGAMTLEGVAKGFLKVSLDADDRIVVERK